jgi:ribosome-binding factor A
VARKTKGGHSPHAQRSFPRASRVADQIQRELAQLLRIELKDPRVGMITVTGVEVSSDLSHAKVFFTTLGDDAQLQDTLEGLRHSTSFLRAQISHRLSLRVVPELHFEYDETVARGARISYLIDDALKDVKQ